MDRESVLSCCTLTTVAVLGVLLGQVCAQEGIGRERRDTERAVRDAVREMNVDFEIRGNVVDQDGGPLSGVGLRVRGLRTPGPFREEHYSLTRKVDRVFELSLSRTYAATLYFSLDGYHSCRLGFSSRIPAEGARIEGHTHTYDDVTVVLHKIGELAQVHRHGCVLSYGLDGTLQAWDLSTVGPVRRQSRLLDLDAIPGPDVSCMYVHLVASPTPIEPQVVGGMEMTPRNAILQVVLQDGQGGGFIRVATEGRSEKEMLYATTTAPTEGYSPTLDLSPGDIAGLRVGAAVYFYCRINGLLGKGYVNSLHFRPDSGVKMCGLRFLIQPNGSTNVETRQW